MLVFLIIGGVGLVLLLLSLLVDGLVDGWLDGIFDFAGDLLSGAALAGLVGAFGFVGALVLGLTDSVGWAIGTGIVAGLLIGLAAGWFSAQLRRGGDHSTVRTASLLGRHGVVITDIPAAGLGEIRVIAAGQPTKLNARAEAPIPAGETVYITAVLTATSVSVAPTGDPLSGDPHS